MIIFDFTVDIVFGSSLNQGQVQLCLHSRILDQTVSSNINLIEGLLLISIDYYLAYTGCQADRKLTHCCLWPSPNLKKGLATCEKKSCNYQQHWRERKVLPEACSLWLQSAINIKQRLMQIKKNIIGPEIWQK